MLKFFSIIFFVFALVSCEVTFNKDHVAAGNALLQQGDILNALTEFDDALFVDRENSEAIRGKYFCYMQIGDFDKALDQANKFVSLKPDSAVSYSNRGIAYLVKKDYNSALIDFNKAISLDSSYPTVAYYNKGQALLGLEQFEEALKCFNIVVTKDNSDSRAFYKRGLCYDGLGYSDSACSNYNKAMSLGDKRCSRFISKEV